MNIRVIAGEYGGRTIIAPKGRRMHPMGERVRGAMFNSIAGEVAGARVLDAFAGTGAVGIEALSRGADEVVFVEKDRIMQRIIQENMKALDIEKKSSLISTTVNNWVEGGATGEFDIIFADPPYHDLQLSTVSKLFGLLKANGLMVLSHTGRGEGPNLTNEIVVVDNRSYGNAYLTFFRRRSA